MAKSISLGKKIGFGFLIMICLTSVVGLAGYFAMQRVQVGAGLFQEMDIIQRDFESVKEQVDTFLLNSYEEGREAQAEAHQAAVGILKREIQSIKRTRRHPFVSGQLDQGLTLVEEIAGYTAAFQNYTDAETTKARLVADIKNLFTAIIHTMKEAEFQIQDAMTRAEVAEASCHMYMDRRHRHAMGKLQDALVDQRTVFGEWYEKMNSSDELRAKGDKIKEDTSADNHPARQLPTQRSSSRRIRNTSWERIKFS